MSLVANVNGRPERCATILSIIAFHVARVFDVVYDIIIYMLISKTKQNVNTYFKFHNANTRLARKVKNRSIDFNGNPLMTIRD